MTMNFRNVFQILIDFFNREGEEAMKKSLKNTDRWEHIMRSSGKSKSKVLNLEKDLLLTREDMIYMNKVRLDADPDLGKYFDFLEEIGAFGGPIPEKIFYDAEFEP